MANSNIAERGSAKALARELLKQHAGPLPVWVRPPKSGHLEFYTGLSRAKLYELAAGNRIVTRTLREPGQIKGTRLFLLSSVLGFIEACPGDMSAAPVIS
jgi:hypothetical protein